MRRIDALTDKLLTTSDDALLEQLRASSPAGSTAAHLLSGLTGDRRRLYKRIATFSRIYAEPDKQQAYEVLYGLDADGAQQLTARLRERLERLVGHPLHPSAVLVDIPPRDKDKLETIPVRYPSASGRSQYQLHELSGIVAGVQHDFVKVVKKIRVFCAAPIAAELVGQDRRVEEALLSEVLTS